MLDPQVTSSTTPTRAQDVELKQARIGEFLEDEGYDAVLLESREAFAWYTSGGRNTLGTGSDPCGALFVTQQRAVLISQHPHVDRMVEEELDGLPLDVEPVAWDASVEDVYQKLRRGLRVASDRGTAGTKNEASLLARLRVHLTPLERHRYRELGRAVSHAIEATCRNFESGESEAEIAGQLSHRLYKHEVVPMQIFIAGDDRIAAHSRPVYGNRPVSRRGLIAATGEKYGLCATSGRMVSFEQPEPNFLKDYEQAALACAAGVFFSQPGVSCADLVEKMRRRYQKMGLADSFPKTPPGHVTGYRPCEIPLQPDSRLELGDSMALVWWPAVGTAASCDTIVIDSEGFEIVTGLRRWPLLTVDVSGHHIDRPDLLVRGDAGD